jgi:hypothetical protein
MSNIDPRCARERHRRDELFHYHVTAAEGAQMVGAGGISRLRQEHQPFDRIEGSASREVGDQELVTAELTLMPLAIALQATVERRRTAERPVVPRRSERSFGYGRSSC